MSHDAPSVSDDDDDDDDDIEARRLLLSLVTGASLARDFLASTVAVTV